jgi:folate-dependent phosphoribosylglycinamide formyltransferase PurN
MRMTKERAGVPRAVYFGMGGVLSRAPLRALLGAGLDVRAVVMPSPARLVGVPPPPDAPPVRVRPARPATLSRGARLPMLAGGGESIAEIADQHQIPVLEVARLAAPETELAVRDFAPDVLCVSCFPWRLPSALLAIPSLGALNVHPSLLPHNRGPDPLFWTFYYGETETGVTIHQMTAELDAGPIISQQTVPVPEGLGEAALERTLAERGGELLAGAVLALARGEAHPRAQEAAQATRFPWPEAEDFRLTSDRPAAWAHRFVCGVRERGQPITVRLGTATYRVMASLGYDAAASLDAPWRLRDGELWLRCAPGVFHAQVVPLT